MGGVNGDGAALAVVGLEEVVYAPVALLTGDDGLHPIEVAVVATGINPVIEVHLDVMQASAGRRIGGDGLVIVASPTAGLFCAGPSATSWAV